MTGPEPRWSIAWEVDDGRAQAESLFHTHFDAAPEVVASAPGRVNVIGEHTDYNAGLCLPVALPHHTVVALRRRTDDVVHLVSAQEPGDAWLGNLNTVAPGAVDGWAGYAVGVAWALRADGQPLRGFDAVVDSCVPYGAGLSSSAALECATALALDDAFKLGLSGSDDGVSRLVAACIRAENEIAGAATGGMDQEASLRAQPGHALLLDFRSGERRHVPLDLGAAALTLLVIDTRARHTLVDGQYASRRSSCEESARLLGLASLREVSDLDAALAALPEDVLRRRVRHVVTETARVAAAVEALERDDFGTVGRLLDASHASLRDDYEVSCAELDLAVEAARAAGALGARMTGGGFGGSAVALVPAADVDQVTRAVDAAFAAAGFTPPVFLDATP